MTFTQPFSPQRTSHFAACLLGPNFLSNFRPPLPARSHLLLRDSVHYTCASVYTSCSRDARRFYDMLVKHMETVLPYLYTPTVGEACMHYHTLNIPTYGMYLPATEKGSFLRKLQALPNQNVAIVVVTDGERILGLGDLGAGGMGIAEGKSLLYTAAAGVDPLALLPVCLDVGTNNTALLSDRLYPGLRRRRLVGQEFEELMEEFVTALISWRPHVCLHFEDFSNHTACVPSSFCAFAAFPVTHKLTDLPRFNLILLVRNLTQPKDIHVAYPLTLHFIHLPWCLQIRFVT
jgi:hypothetical protein